MKFYGSVINRIEEQAPVASEIHVGDGATLYQWSDRAAYTVRSVKVSPSGKTITVTATRDKVRRIDSLGMTDSGQQWECTPDDNATVETFVSRSGKPFRSYANGPVLRIGKRDEHYDYSF